MTRKLQERLDRLERQKAAGQQRRDVAPRPASYAAPTWGGCSIEQTAYGEWFDSVLLSGEPWDREATVEFLQRIHHAARCRAESAVRVVEEHVRGVCAYALPLVRVMRERGESDRIPIEFVNLEAAEGHEPSTPTDERA